jgi:hypothetical protein
MLGGPMIRAGAGVRSEPGHGSVDRGRGFHI